MPWPTIHKNPRAAAATVHDDPIVQIGVVCICGFSISYSGKISRRKSDVGLNIEVFLNIRLRFPDRNHSVFTIADGSEVPPIRIKFPQ